MSEGTLGQRARAALAQAFANMSPEQPTYADLKASMANSLDRMRMRDPNQQGPHLPEDTAMERRYYTALSSGLGDTVGSVGKKAAAKVADALPMDEASRLARAKEMGFDTGKTWYHGTGNRFDEFEPMLNGSNTDSGNLGAGHYFSSEPRIASYYADYAQGTRFNSPAPNVLPVHLRSENWFEVMDKNPETLERVAESLGVKAKAEWNGSRQINPDWSAELTKKAKEAGYTGIKVDGANEAVIFDPSRIRSKFAAFDPKKKGSGNLSAGIGAAALGGGLLGQEEAMRRRVEGSK